MFCNKPQDSYDHDYSYLADGTVIPHGIYDMKGNRAYIHLNDSHETAELIGDSLALWWRKEGRELYPDARRILILSDAGGANSYRNHGYKHAIQKFANESGLEIVIAHYPSYTSKYNPIEHRVFPHVSRTLSGAKLTNLKQVESLISRTKTKTGLKVMTGIMQKVYKTGKKYAKKSLEKLKITYGKVLPKWNYSIMPMDSYEQYEYNNGKLF